MSFDCRGKRRYATFNEAKRTARYQHEKMNETLRPYRCTQCRGFHIGSVNEVEQQKQRDKRRRKMEPAD